MQEDIGDEGQRPAEDRARLVTMGEAGRLRIARRNKGEVGQDAALQRGRRQREGGIAGRQQADQEKNRPWHQQEGLAAATRFREKRHAVGNPLPLSAAGAAQGRLHQRQAIIAEIHIVTVNEQGRRTEAAAGDQLVGVGAQPRP